MLLTLQDTINVQSNIVETYNVGSKLSTMLH